jgi:hypothetical protein
MALKGYVHILISCFYVSALCTSVAYLCDIMSNTAQVCAYAAHCHQLGYMNEDVMAGLHEVFAKLASSEADMNGLLANVLRVGELNGKVLAMLDEAHATTFGAPEPTQVKVTATEGKAILVMVKCYQLIVTLVSKSILTWLETTVQLGRTRSLSFLPSLGQL